MAQPPSSLGSRILHSPAWRQNQPLLLVTCFYIVSVFAVSRAIGMEKFFNPAFYWENVVDVTL
ncbi:MAG TPA: hypothetical protein VD713_04335, partial [Sphingomonadales bacterium]|nr:hypothetical protein [Sphingomonadales bacterium]